MEDALGAILRDGSACQWVVSFEAVCRKLIYAHLQFRFEIDDLSPDNAPLVVDIIDKVQRQPGHCVFGQVALDVVWVLCQHELIGIIPVGPVDVKFVQVDQFLGDCLYNPYQIVLYVGLLKVNESVEQHIPQHKKIHHYAYRQDDQHNEPSFCLNV